MTIGSEYLYPSRSANFVAVVVIGLSACSFLVASMLTITDFAHETTLIMLITAEAGIGIYCFINLWRRDGFLPILDIGITALIAMLIYMIEPVSRMILADFRFTNLSSLQLARLSPTANDILPLVWRYFAFTAVFGITYLAFRKPGVPRKPLSENTAKSMLRILLFIFIVMSVIMKLFEYKTGLSLDPTYDNSTGTNYEQFLGLPLLAQQLVSHFVAAFNIIRFGILLCLVSLWHNAKTKYIIYLVLIYMIIDNTLLMRQRTTLLLNCLAIIVAYHQFIRPIDIRKLLLIGIVLFLWFQIYGWVRGGGNFEDKISRLEESTDDTEFHSKATEFQALFGGTYDLYNLTEVTGSNNPVPWYSPIFDLISLIPSQLLPFEKWDPDKWYCSNYSAWPGYFMFNPICQSLVGFGWIELLVRATLLAWIFARIRQWYLKRDGQFLPALFYLWMTLTAFYSIRGSSFGFLTSVVQVFIPTLIMVKVVSVFFQRSN